MASIQKRGKGSFLIQWVDHNGKRRGLSLSRTNMKFVQSLATRIEAINAAKRAGHPIDSQTATWLQSIGDILATRLANAGLIDPVVVAELGKFLDEYFASRTDWKPRTRRKHNTTKDYLEAFFTREKLLRDITEDDADAFHRHLKHEVAAIESESTIWKHISNARVYFNGAIRRRILSKNPFAHCKVRKVSGQNFYFITSKEAGLVLEACPDNQWRMIFALARYGGLRIPSEIEGLQWDHVLWSKHRFLVHSPKTELYTGQDKRFVPLFPELRRHLDEGFHLAGSKAKYVITATRKANGELSDAYIRKRMLIIVERAGIVPWPKLFQNLRSTRQTELENSFPSHKVCKWLGNSEKVANKHYLQTVEEDFREAAKETQTEDSEVLHQLMQRASELVGNGENWDLEELSQVLGIPELAQRCSDMLTPQVAAEGLDTILLKALIAKRLERKEK